MTVGLLGIWIPAVAGQQAPSVADQFTGQQAAMAAVEDRAGVYRVAIDYSYTLASGERYSKPTTNYLVTRKPGHIRIQADDARMVFCSNPTYMFVAAKPKPGSYLLAQYRAGTEYGSESVRENEFNRFVRNYHFVAYPLTECVDSDYRWAATSGRLRLTAVERAETGTRVRYSRPRGGPEGRPSGTLAGTMTFDDAGRLTRLSEQATGGGSYKMEKTWTHAASLSDGTRFTSTEAVDVFVDGLNTTTRCVVTPLPDPPAGDHEFYLSRYGLPEPIGGVAPVGPVPLWWWFVGAAVLAVLAAGCNRLVRRRAAGSPSPGE